MKKDNNSKYSIDSRLRILPWFLCPMVVELVSNSNMRSESLSNIDVAIINFNGVIKNLCYLLLVMSYLTPGNQEYGLAFAFLGYLVLLTGLIQYAVYIQR